MGVTCRAAFHPRHVHRCGGSEHTRRNLFALHHILKWSAKTARLPPSGGIRIAALAAPAINQSGRGRCAVFIRLLYSRLTRPESGACPCAAVYSRLCGVMRCCRGVPYSAFRIPHSEFPLPFSTKKGGASPSRLFLISADYYLSSFLYSARSFTAASCLPVFSRRSR